MLNPGDGGIGRPCFDCERGGWGHDEACVPASRLLSARMLDVQLSIRRAYMATQGLRRHVPIAQTSRVQHRGAGNEPFNWSYVGQSEPLKAWCAKNVTDPAMVSKLAVKKLVAQGTLTESVAVDRVRELLGR